MLLHPNDTFFQHAARALGQHLAPGVASEALGRTVWDGVAANDPVRFWNGDEKIRTWSRHAGLSTAAGAAIWKHVHERDLHEPLWSIPEASAQSALTTLVGAGYRLAVVSNNDGRLRQQLTNAALLPYFDAIIDSATHHAVKPDPAIFNAATDELGVHPSECLMIGDDPHFDIQASLEAGIVDTILIDKLDCRPPTWPTRACPDLSAAADLLKVR
ncbi:HAD family hydrolase [Actinoplanes sp. CA-054009]